MDHGDETCLHLTDLPSLLRCLRERRLWSQARLAEETGLREKTISSLETGKRREPHLPTLNAIADALELSTAERDALMSARHRAKPPNKFLPQNPTPFFGRAEAIQELLTRARAKDGRLLTLTGPGGIGKTRLATEVAARLEGDFDSNVRFVDLSQLDDHRLVPRAIAAAVEAPLTERGSVEEETIAACRDQRLLLVLDNFERLIEARRFVERLVVASPRLHCLVTSRERLGSAFEQRYAVGPLALPESSPAMGGEPATSDAVALFVQRAQAAYPPFALTAQNGGEIAEICLRLDGIPLAIELAAARIAHFGTARALLKQLDPRLPWLTRGWGGPGDRHQTMRAAIDWSYATLSPAEQRIFRHAAVFVGGCTMEALVEVCGDSPARQPVFDGLFSLIDKSVVHLRAGAADEPRYLMLETIREFGEEQLIAQGEDAEARTRHAGVALAFAEQAEQMLTGPEQAEWMARLETEYGNLREALSWLIRQDGGERALRIGSALWQFWAATGRLGEGRDWLGRAVALTGSATPESRAKALLRLGNLAVELGDYTEARGLFEASAAISESTGDPLGTARALGGLGFVLLNQGEYAEARRSLEATMMLLRELNSLRGQATTLQNLGKLALADGDFGLARDCYERSLVIRQELGDASGVAYSRVWLGQLERLSFRLDEARVHLDLALATFQEVGERAGEGYTLLELGSLAHHDGGTADALDKFQASLEMWRSAGDEQGMVDCLEAIAGLACEWGRLDQGVAIYAVAAKWRAENSVPATPLLHVQHRKVYETARLAVQPKVVPSFTEAVGMAASLTLNEAETGQRRHSIASSNPLGTLDRGYS